MDDKDKRVTPQELRALGVGLLVTIASALLTTLFVPVAFPFNFLVSLALGGAAGYGALKVLDPRTMEDLLEAQTETRVRQMLSQIAAIAARTGEAGRSLSQTSPEVSGRLGAIASMTERIRDRYTERPRDYSGIAATLLILQRFDEILAHYLRVKRGDLFLDDDERGKEIVETETEVIPMFEMALDNLGKKLDAGEVIHKGVSKGTLESMLQSLNLINDLSDQIGASSEKGDLR